MHVKLWGVRGSLPSPMTPDQVRERFTALLKDFERFSKANPSMTADVFMEAFPRQYTGGYGGNTSCAEVTYGSSRLIIDAGSGIRNLSEELLKLNPQPSEFHLYFTHFHWDHLIGLPFFVPIYMRGKTVHIYGVQENLEACIRGMFQKPQFPVPFEVIQQQVQFHRVEPRQPFQVGELTVTPYQLDHPDPCWGARVEAGGKSLAWAVDSECTRATSDQLGKDVLLYRNVDVMVFDAQYTFDQAMEKISWGHSSGPIGIDLALREGVKQALFIHHDPGATDEMIRAAEQETLRYFEEMMRARQNSGLEVSHLRWHFASEGEKIKVG